MKLKIWLHQLNHKEFFNQLLLEKKKKIAAAVLNIKGWERVYLLCASVQYETEIHLSSAQTCLLLYERDLQVHDVGARSAGYD